MGEALQDIREQVNLAQAPRSIRDALAVAHSGMVAAQYRLTVDNAAGRAAALLTAWSGALALIRSDMLASNHVKRAAEDALREDALQALKDLERDFHIALERYREKLLPAVAPIPADEAMRLWQRVERQLNAGIAVAEIVPDADGRTLAVMLEELPSWRRASMPGDLQAAKFISDGDVALILQRQYEMASPEERQRLDEAKRSERGAYNLQVTFNQVRNAILNLDDCEQVLLVNWDDSPGRESTFVVPLKASGRKLYL